MKTMKTLAAVLMLTLFGAGMARADDKPAGVLDDNGLKTMLENLGYEPKPIPLKNGRTSYLIKVAIAGYATTDMEIKLSDDNTMVWGFLGLTELKSEHTANAPRLVKILQLNMNYGPCHFRIEPNGTSLFVVRGTPNKAITAKDLKNHIDSLVSAASDTSEHWDSRKWNAAAPKPMPAPDPMPVPEVKK